MSQESGMIANGDGGTVRAAINANLQAILSTSKGSNRPSTVYGGQLWIDDNTPSSTVWTLNLYDGADDIALGTFDTVNNKFSPSNAGTTVSSIKVQVFSTVGTTSYTPSAGLLFADAQVQGGGGAGGSSTGAPAPSASAGNGGSVGGYARKLFTAAQITAALSGGSISCTVGAGGSAGSAGNFPGGNGAASSFGALLSASAGNGGGGDAAKSVVNRSTGIIGGSGTGSGGDINSTGEYGSYGIAYGPSSAAVSGQGGASFFGGGGRSVVEGNNGASGATYGSGGSGAASSVNSQTGGPGGGGVIIITEYCSQ